MLKLCGFRQKQNDQIHIVLACQPSCDAKTVWILPQPERFGASCVSIFEANMVDCVAESPRYASYRGSSVMSVSPWYVVSFVAVVCRAVGFSLNRPTLRVAPRKLRHVDVAVVCRQICRRGMSRCGSSMCEFHSALPYIYGARASFSALPLVQVIPDDVSID